MDSMKIGVLRLEYVISLFVVLQKGCSVVTGSCCGDSIIVLLKPIKIVTASSRNLTKSLHVFSY